MIRSVALLAAATAATPAVAQLSHGAGSGPSPGRVAAALLVCLLLAAAGALALKARGGTLPRLRRAGGSARRLVLVESVRIDAQAGVSILRCDDAEYLVAISPAGGVRLLRRLAGEARDADG